MSAGSLLVASSAFPGRSLTFSLLIFRRFQKTLELDIDVDLDAQQESHFEQHQLELTNTYHMWENEGGEKKVNNSVNSYLKPQFCGSAASRADVYALI